MTQPPDAVDRFARVDPPTAHVGQVLMRSGPGVRASAAASSPARVPWRWALPIAASALVIVGAAVQSDRAARQVGLMPPPAEPGWTGKGVDLPVLPPRAYWQMSATEEFEQLRPGMLAPPAAAPGSRRPEAIAEATAGQISPRPDPMPEQASLLPPIVIADITPPPIAMADLSPLPPIAIAPITLTPIAITPIAREDQ